MERLSFGGETYVKASSAARELGYTADYIGQLCRNEKVTARLVGRTWYVEEKSLLEHKGSRYRANTIKTKQAIRRIVSTQESSAETSRRASGGSRVRVRYSSDETDLIPKPHALKPRQVETVIETHDVEVLEDDSPYVIETPDLPEIRFRGPLKISALDQFDELMEADTSSPQKFSREGSGPRQARDLTVRDEPKADSELSVPIHTKHTSAPHLSRNRKYTFSRKVILLYVLSLLGGIIAVWCYLGVKQSVYSTGVGELNTVYNLDQQQVIDSLYTLKNLVFSF